MCNCDVLNWLVAFSESNGVEFKPRKQNFSVNLSVRQFPWIEGKNDPDTDTHLIVLVLSFNVIDIPVIIWMHTLFVRWLR